MKRHFYWLGRYISESIGALNTRDPGLESLGLVIPFPSASYGGLKWRSGFLKVVYKVIRSSTVKN